MKQLQLRNGDLVIGPGGFGLVRGARKIQQDLGMAVRETLGTDRFHPRYGTVLHQTVGGLQTDEALMLIKAEVSRVVQNYMMVQTEEITRDMDAGRRSRYTPDEIISSVDSIDIQQSFDRVNIRVQVRTYQGDSVTVIRSVEV